MGKRYRTVENFAISVVFAIFYLMFFVFMVYDIIAILLYTRMSVNTVVDMHMPKIFFAGYQKNTRGEGEKND